VSEHAEQVALFTWARYQTVHIPELSLLHAIPNGGHRHIAVASRMKAEGVRAGVPDICLPVPRGGYHGLYLEMKFGKNTVSAAQQRWLTRLAAQGYATVVCYGFEEAQSAILAYLEEEFDERDR
jgi:hypothetical protein